MNPGPPVWATYVNVDDADKVVPLVAANGGNVIVPPMDVLDVGRMAVFSDPAGAVISIWQARAHIGAGIVNEPGTLSWNELQTTDIPGAKTFYGAVFGWDSETHGEGPMAYTEWKIDGRSIGGMMAKPPNIPAEVPPFWGVYFAVTDADATTDQIRELDGTIVVPPMDIEPGRFGVATDPTGAMFNFIAMRETA
jgi:predicted enzyme related to lactoylglutathione lyase